MQQNISEVYPRPAKSALRGYIWLQLTENHECNYITNNLWLKTMYVQEQNALLIGAYGKRRQIHSQYLEL